MRLSLHKTSAAPAPLLLQRWWFEKVFAPAASPSGHGADKHKKRRAAVRRRSPRAA